jgi:hypothetical protein
MQTTQLQIDTHDRRTVDITDDVRAFANSAGADGLLHVFVPHATAMPAPKRLQWGDVTLVGPDVRVAKRGDQVLFLPSSGLEVELQGEDLVLLRERDVQAVSPAPASRSDRVPGQYL